MNELVNCPNCGELFVKNMFRTLCQPCTKEEELAFDAVYAYMRNRENRAATILQVVEATGVEEEMIYKFIKVGRLKTTQFPNLGFPCERCGAIIRKGTLCIDCQDYLRSELQQFQNEELRKKEMQKKEHGAYLSEKR